MRAGWRKRLDDRFLASIGLAVLLLACWQVLNHYFLMNWLMAQLGLSMVYYHYLSFVVELLLVSLVALFASRALAAKNRELEEVDRQKDLLTNALVHDLRQPLTAVISGLSSVALDPDVPASTQELVEIARSGADELLGMVNDLLDINRLEGGRPLAEPRPTDLAKTIRSGVNRVAGLARERGQQLTVDLEDGLPGVIGDPERLSRVVTNLVGNAIKYTPDGGSIHVHAASDDGRGGVVVSVSDTGPGIPAESREAIFDKFATLQPNASGARTSTGLGLTFCKLVVEAHGGRIWVDCPPGQGSTFAFSLPAGPGACQRSDTDIAA